MTFKQMLTREKHIVIHGQTARFRLVKYAILIPAFVLFYAWRGWNDTVTLLIVLFVASVAIHLLFRWKTKAWTRSWGPYKKIDLPA